MKNTFRATALTLTLLTVTTLSFGQWTSRFNGQGDFSDNFNAIQKDGSGNICMAGSTISTDKGRDLLMVKLNAAGDTLWTNIYSGAGNGNDEALAMTIDNSDNIYVTGYSKGAGTGYDFITIKYQPDGTIAWTSTYNYLSNEFDQSNSIVVDADGNVYIAGQSDKDATIINNDDYVIVKYNPDGTTAWTKRSNGAGNSTDRPLQILLATDGNLIVTGRSDNLSDDDYMTIKYNASNGNEMWRKYFDRTHHDRPTGMVIDPSSGKIYITGRSNNGSNYDYATLCYSSTGVLQWQAIFDYVDDDRATAIGIDGSENIYVTGQSDIVASAISTNYDILTVKYNSSGTQQWAQSWGGSALNDDVPAALFTDNSGNTYITGYSDTEASSTANSNDIAVLKYNNSGTLQYATTFSRSATSNDVPKNIAADNSGNLFITGYTENIPNKDALTIKVNASGNVDWQYDYNGIGDNSDNSHFILRDGANNMYVAGYTVAYGADRNFLLLKLNASGDLVWKKEINGTSYTQSTDDAIAMTFDGDGNICVTGFTKNSGTGYDIQLAKYSSAGDSLWSKTYNYDAANETDKAVAIAVDGANNIYITGRSDQDETFVSNDDIITLKYSASGVLQWAQRYNGIGNGIDNAKAIKVTTSGNTYVAGKTFSGTNTDIILIKYNTLGVQQWLKTFDRGGDDEAVNMVMDADENLVITGNSINTSGDHLDIVTLKYSADGALLWSAAYDNAFHGNDDAKGIALDGNNNIYVCGTSQPDTSAITLNGDIVTIKYNSDGNEIWVNSFDGDGAANDDASEIAIDINNIIYVTGQADNGVAGNINYDFVTLTYDPDGNQQDIQFYNGPGNASDVANTVIAFDNAYYVSGGSFGESTQRDIATILYGKTPVGISVINQHYPELLVYPNPFTDYAVISLPEQLINSTGIQIIIRDISGRPVLTDVTDYQPYYTIQNNNYPAGLYFIQIFSENTLIAISQFNIQ